MHSDDACCDQIIDNPACPSMSKLVCAAAELKPASIAPLPALPFLKFTCAAAEYVQALVQQAKRAGVCAGFSAQPSG
jgi:hypothetical protein